MAEKKSLRVVACRVPVRDGFTLQDVYREDGGVIYAGVAITYRPALQTEAADFIDDPRKFIVKGRELVLKHVTGWNVANDDGTDVAPLTPQSVEELAYPVLTWAINCITGYAPRSEVTDAKN